MHGLARFQHDEVGDVHDVVDGPHARAVEVFAHPLRRGADLYFINDAGGMVLGQVEKLKVVVVVLDLRPFDHLITHANEDLHQFFLHGVPGVGRAGGTGPYRHGHVDGLAL